MQSKTLFLVGNSENRGQQSNNGNSLINKGFGYVALMKIEQATKATIEGNLNVLPMLPVKNIYPEKV